MQFFHSIIYLIVTIGLVFLYLLFLLLLVLAVRYGKKVWVLHRSGTPLVRVNLPMFFYRRDLRYLYILLLLSVFINSSIYISQRVIWLGEDNKHLKAKEYWVAGQVVYINRSLAGKILHPENPLLLPFRYLQKVIYHRGIKYLPGNDGEKFVWYNHWFLYPFAQKYIRPYGIGDKDYEPKMVALLDTCWDTMQGMMTKEIEDKKIYKEYLLKFPFLASYYATFQGHYTGKFLHSGSRKRTNELYMKKNNTILKWLDILYEDWEKNGYLDEIWRNYPFVANCRQLLVTEVIQDIALWLPTEGTFSCDHPIMKRMHKEYQTNMSGDPELNPIFNLKRKNKKQARLTYLSAIYSARGSSGKYLISDICKKEMPEELYLLAEKNIETEFYEPYSVEYVFRKELKPLLKGEPKTVK